MGFTSESESKWGGKIKASGKRCQVTDESVRGEHNEYKMTQLLWKQVLEKIKYTVFIKAISEQNHSRNIVFIDTSIL